MYIKKLTMNGVVETPAAPAVPGPSYPHLILEQKVEVTTASRGDGGVATLELRDDHVIELIYEDGTSWLCSPDTLEELYPGMLTQQRGNDGFVLPATVVSADATRSLAGQIALKVLNLFSRKMPADWVAKAGMKELATVLEQKQLGESRGLFRVGGAFELLKYQAGDTTVKAGPILLFIHGTNSSSTGSFAELAGSDLWAYMTKTYGGNVLAFNHETLTKSPLQNAAELAAQLPANAEIHLITHSRGGLVGEILARCGDSDTAGAEIGFTAAEVALLNKEGRTGDVEWIGKLQDACRKQPFKITKFVRVACPTGGTTILAKRLDHFLNISLNVIGFAMPLTAKPVYDAMKDLLTAAIDQKNDPDVLPGLEAMNPASPFIKVLNDQGASIGRPVVAISGNCKAKLNLKALLILAEKLFFGEDNDLVVNTPSMYAGSQRKYKLQFFFDEGTDVDHFHYFVNQRTNTAIHYALQSTGDDQIDGFAEYSRGGLSLALADVQARGGLSGLQGGDYSTGEPSGKKPIVVLLPGIMGSCLAKDDETIWISYLRMLGGALSGLAIDGTGTIKAPGIIETSYKKLGDWLSKEYDVVTFAFDWRLAPQAAAQALATKIQHLLTLQQPIKLVAHSLGGVVVRDLMVFFSGVWKDLNASPKFSLVFLGSPLRGSFRILNVLLGEDDIINKLSKLDLRHTKQELLQVFDGFPGVLGLMPLVDPVKDPGNDLSNPATWTNVLNAFGNPQWPQPSTGDLQNFGAYRTAVLAAMDQQPGLDLSHAAYVAGQFPQTPCGYRIDLHGDEQSLVLLSTAEGDQSVTWDSGIPAAMITAGNVYYVNHSHGELSNAEDMFAGITELLEKGKTDLFSQSRPVVRGEQRVFRKPETTDFDLSPEGLSNTLLGLSGTGKQPAQSGLPLKVGVTHGDVKYCRFPVMAGHFKLDSILYAEKRIDALLGGQLEKRFKLGLYPGAIGTFDIVLANEKIHGAIIVGLGEPDTLTGSDLSVSVEHATAKYLLLVNGQEKLDAYRFKDPIGISSLLIGCGYGGLSVDTVVQAVLQGVVNANGRISQLYGDQARLIVEVEFVELYQDRALAAYYAVRRVGKESGGALKVIPAASSIVERPGARQKVNMGEGRDWWNRITISKNADDKGVIKGMNYSISTGAAREELEDLYTIGGVVDGLIDSISTDNKWSAEKARAVFELLIPNSYKSRLKRNGNITWVLDKYTAGYPWELLQQKGDGVKPLCINAGMIRQLATSDFRLNIESVKGETALVVGDPKTSGFLPQLPGALAEAKAVADTLKAHGFDTLDLLQREQDVITTSLMSGSYKIIHLSGHGLFDPDPDKPSGMVIGKNSFLGTKQIAQMSDTPDLVFVNCCFLGKTDAAAEQYYQSRFKLAANIGTQLIENGVKAVVVAGWAVEDAAAQRFASTFYERMFMGIPFGEAVRQAREDVYNHDNSYNTWGAYQCYGNPWYKLRSVGGVQAAMQYVIAEQAEIDLANLNSDMGTGDYPDKDILARLQAISDETDRCGIRMPAITEWEAQIYKGLNLYEQALAKYKQLLSSPSGNYSFIAVEQYCNLRAKLLRNQQAAGGVSTAVLQEEFSALIKELEALLLLSPTAERYDILASTWKRRCSLYFDQPDARQALEDAVREAASGYRNAFTVAPGAYSYTNWISLENVLVAAQRQQWDKVMVDQIGGVLTQLEADCGKRPPSNVYWDMILVPNIRLVQWMVAATRAGELVRNPEDEQAVADSYFSVWQVAGTTDAKMSELQHLELLISALKGLQSGHFMIGRLEAVAAALKAKIG